MHSSILLDADPTQLEPFPLAIIMNEKEDARYFKSSGNQNHENDVLPNNNQSEIIEPSNGVLNNPPIEGDSSYNSRANALLANDTSRHLSSGSESESHTPIQHQSSMPPTPLTASAISASIANNAAAKLDHYSNMSILTPASSGGYSSAGQISSVSSPSQESPLMADTPNSSNAGTASSGPCISHQNEENFE